MSNHIVVLASESREAQTLGEDFGLEIVPSLREAPSVNLCLGELPDDDIKDEYRLLDLNGHRFLDSTFSPLSLEWDQHEQGSLEGLHHVSLAPLEVEFLLRLMKPFEDCALLRADFQLGVREFQGDLRGAEEVAAHYFEREWHMTQSLRKAMRDRSFNLSLEETLVGHDDLFFRVNLELEEEVSMTEVKKSLSSAFPDMNIHSERSFSGQAEAETFALRLNPHTDQRFHFCVRYSRVRYWREHFDRLLSALRSSS